MSNLSIGDVVVKNDKYHVPNGDKGQEFVVNSEPWNVCGTMVVKLMGRSGSYAADGLNLVRKGEK